MKTLAFSVGLYGLFTVLVVFVKDWHALLLYRFFAGFGVGGAFSLVSTVYISENLERKQPGRCPGRAIVTFLVEVERL